MARLYPGEQSVCDAALIADGKVGDEFDTETALR